MLANPVRGQVAFQANGQGYTLSYSVNALCSAEQAMGLKVSEIGSLLASKDLSLGKLRTVFHAGLGDHQPDLSEADAGLLIGELGIAGAVPLIAGAFLAAFPAVGGEKATARPRTAKGGTGSHSLKHGAPRT